MLHRRVREGELLVGALLRMPAEETTEQVAAAGVDYIVVDCEHGPDGVVELRQHIAVARLHGVEVIVRVGEAGAALALRALDAGASGIIGPHVDTPEQASALVGACHYPPLGQRGFATYSRAAGFGTRTPAEHQARGADTLVFAMPESPRSAANADAIFRVPGLDGYMIGVADLAASTTGDDPAPADSCRAIHAAGRTHGMARMDIVGSAEAAAAAVADGAQLVTYNLTAVLMATVAGLLEVKRAR